MKTYFFTYLCSFVLALIATPITIFTACKFNIVDPVEARKVHSRSIPRIGGAVIFLSSSALVVTILFLDNAIGEAFRKSYIQFLMLLICGSFIFIVGLIDDLHPIRARHKLAAQVAAAVALFLAGVRIDSIQVANLFTLELGWFSLVVTVFWIIAITNAVNLIDGLDGLAAGICAITCGTIAFFAFVSGQVLMVVLMLALLGSLCGFLFFNFNPARIFMGDSGSMYLGFLLGSSSVICAYKTHTVVALALPALALGLPIFDTAFSILRRYLGRWGIMTADRGHLHHRLLDMGLGHRNVVILMYIITALAAGLGLFMMITDGSGMIAVFFSVLILFVILFRLFGAIRVREVIAKIENKKHISQKVEEDKKIFENTYLELGRDFSFKNWRKVLIEIAEKLDFSELALTITSKNSRRHRYLSYSKEIAGQGELITIKVSMNETRLGLPVEIEAKMPINGSMESCGRRMMLVGRLIDEYGISQSDEQGYPSAILELSKNNSYNDESMKPEKVSF